MTPEEQIRAVIEEAGKAFTNLDFDRWEALFSRPRTFILPNGVVSTDSYDETRKKLYPMFERMKEQGFKYSKMDLCNVKTLTDTTALVSTLWTRFKADDEVLEKLGALYLLVLSEDVWKIAVLTAHGDDTVVVKE